MSPKRTEAANILSEIPTTAEGIRSDKQSDEFFRRTGYRHADMMASWRANMSGPPANPKQVKLLTACGGFVSYFAGRIGITGIASFFDLKESLFGSGKGHAWVAAASGAKPQVGDILRHTVFHVDVAAGWDGAKLKRVAAGQSQHPRPTKSVEGEFDALKWVTGQAAYSPANLQGWLDLDLYFGAAPPPGPSLDWLHGWWKVWDGQTYYYHFAPGGTARYTKTPPQPASGPPKFPTNTGVFTYSPGQLVVTWNRLAGVEESCRETFYNAAPGCRQMNANSNLYGPLVAVRLG